jgi:uncharacterized membrane protein YtjA (UPF0391 family)
MLRWILVFFVIALISGGLGFSGVLTGDAVNWARAISILGLTLFLLSLIVALVRGTSDSPPDGDSRHGRGANW